MSIERLEERAKALAARFTLDPNPRRTSRSVLPRFDDNARVLGEAYVAMADDVHRGAFVSPAAEWFLDNFHLVASEILDVRRDLPQGYYRELPKLALRELAGDARVYAIAVELIRHSDSRLDRQQLVRFMNSYQAVTPLTIGELWAWPSMLKLALIDHLRRLSEELLASRAGRRQADRYFALFEGTRPSGRPPPLPALLHVAFVDRLLQRMREHGAGAAELRRRLDRLYRHYDHRFVDPDPLQFVRRQRTGPDREVVGLVASALAYGNVVQIKRSIAAALEVLGPRPSQSVRRLDPRAAARRLASFRHRFNDGRDVACLLFFIRQMIE